jgi:ubiquitin C-terminal hydrolase
MGLLMVKLLRRGATCYLNSLIQAMYMTPELRNGLFAIDPGDLGLQVT